MYVNLKQIDSVRTITGIKEGHNATIQVHDMDGPNFVFSYGDSTYRVNREGQVVAITNRMNPSNSCGIFILGNDGEITH